MYTIPMRYLLILALPLLLLGCAHYELKNLAKSDIDMVSDEFIDKSRRLVQELTVKLYKRNPIELKKNPGMTIEMRLAQLRNQRVDFADVVRVIDDKFELIIGHFHEPVNRFEVDAVFFVEGGACRAVSA